MAKGNLFRSLPLEEADLAERGTDAGHMEEHLFEHASSSEDIRGNESPGLLGKVHQNCAGLGEDKRLAAGTVRIDDDRNLPIRVQCQVCG